MAIGRKMSRFIVERPANSCRTSANAISVPRIVATTVASSPISTERTTAEHMLGSSHGFSQLCSVNPSKR